jgi:predicted AAA+ superfamily ATPase
MADYYTRFADSELTDRLKRAGGVLIRGPKGCGKTETARQCAHSEVLIDDSGPIEQLMAIDPLLLLDGETPRLIDEWQEQKSLWNIVRHEIDRRKQTAQFILTGSANPEEDARLHSGFGRFSVMNMRPMSLFESRLSSGSVSLASLWQAEPLPKERHDNKLSDIIDWIIVGGWPGHLHRSAHDALLAMRDNIELIAEVDLSRVSHTKRDPLKVRQLLRSLARNISTEVTIETLRTDAEGAAGALAYETVVEYLDALQRIMVLENLDAWSTHIRSSATLRKAKKCHFVDPSLAVAALGLDKDKLMNDIPYVGLLFESLVVRDLRIYAQANDARVYHYRDSNGKEADVIVEKRDGSWAAFEIKLGFGAVETAVRSLLAFANTIDTSKTPAPTSLNVITGSGPVAQHSQGINIIPITALRA